MKMKKREYITPVTEFVEVEIAATMLTLSANDGEVDTDGEDGGWAPEHRGDWENIWGNM